MRAASLLLTCLALIACGDDEGGDDSPRDDGGSPVVDSGAPVDSGHSGGGHEHDLDASVADARVVDAALDPTCSATVSLQDYKLVPADITVNAGTVTLCARNDGAGAHDLALRGSDQSTTGKTATLNPGQTGRFEVAVTAGSYVTFCSLPGHESLGMKGTLTAR